MQGLLLTVGLLVAVPPGDERPRASTEAQVAAGQYAQVVMAAIVQIRNVYARDLDESELACVAIEGLYESTRQPLPTGLLAELRRTESSSRRTALLIEARERLGDRPDFANSADVMASLRSLPKALDPHSGLVSDADQIRRDGGFGVGFELAGVSASTNAALPPGLPPLGAVPPGLMPATVTVPFPWRVESVVPGGPAQQAGFRPGDRVTHIAGREISPANSAELYDAMNAPVGGRISFTLRRVGQEKPLYVTVAKGEYTPETVYGVRRTAGGGWDYWLDREAGIAQVRLGSVERSSPAEMAEALRQLRRDGLRGLLLDLRWCPGGYLNESVQIAGVFLEEGLIAKATYRNSSNPDREFRAGTSGLTPYRLTDVPVVVLVNAETSGAGELVAAALQDHERATVVGQRTRGKGSIQQIVSVNLPGYSFKVTQGEFLRASGEGLQRPTDGGSSDDWGVRPEPRHRVRLSDEASDQLKRWWELQTLRPGNSRESLPLDDPEADPQRNFALGVLREILKE